MSSRSLFALSVAAFFAVPALSAQSGGHFLGAFSTARQGGTSDVVDIGGGEVLVAGYSTNVIGVYDGAGTFVRPFAMAPSALVSSLEATRDGDVAAVTGNGRFLLFSPVGDVIIDVPTTAGFTSDVVETAAGDFLIGGNGGIRLIDGATGATLPHPFPERQASRGLDIDADGDVFSVSEDGIVSKYDGATGQLLAQTSTPAGPNVHDAEIGPDGGLYFGAAFGATTGVYRVDSEAMGEPVLVIEETDVDDPFGLGFVGDELWVTSYSGSTVSRFAPLDTAGEEASPEPGFGDAPLVAFPNPASDQATLSFAVAESVEASVVVYDLLGREVARPFEGVAAGPQQVSLDASALPAGVYVARLVVGGRAETVRISVVR